MNGAKRNHTSGSAKNAPIKRRQRRKANAAEKYFRSAHGAAAFGVRLRPIAEVDQREDEVDQHDDDADRRALAELEVAERHTVVVDRQELGPVARPAIGQKERREDVERPHGDEDEVGDHVPADQRQADVAELLPARCAGHVGGLEIARRDRGEGRVEQHHRERRAAPGVEDHDDPERAAAAAKSPRRQAKPGEDAC